MNNIPVFLLICLFKYTKHALLGSRQCFHIGVRDEDKIFKENCRFLSNYRTKNLLGNLGIKVGTVVTKKLL